MAAMILSALGIIFLCILAFVAVTSFLYWLKPDESERRVTGLVAENPDWIQVPADTEPFGGNLYRAHIYRFASGLWECRHGVAAGNAIDAEPQPTWLRHPRWMVCKKCAFNDPVAYVRWRYASDRPRPGIGWRKAFGCEAVE